MGVCQVREKGGLLIIFLIPTPSGRRFGLFRRRYTAETLETPFGPVTRVCGFCPKNPRRLLASLSRQLNEPCRWEKTEIPSPEFAACLQAYSVYGSLSDRPNAGVLCETDLPSEVYAVLFAKTRYLSCRIPRDFSELYRTIGTLPTDPAAFLPEFRITGQRPRQLILTEPMRSFSAGYDPFLFLWMLYSGANHPVFPRFFQTFVFKAEYGAGIPFAGR